MKYEIKTEDQLVQVVDGILWTLGVSADVEWEDNTWKLTLVDDRNPRTVEVHGVGVFDYEPESIPSVTEALLTSIYTAAFIWRMSFKEYCEAFDKDSDSSATFTEYRGDMAMANYLRQFINDRGNFSALADLTDIIFDQFSSFTRTPVEVKELAEVK